MNKLSCRNTYLVNTAMTATKPVIPAAITATGRNKSLRSLFGAPAGQTTAPSASPALAQHHETHASRSWSPVVNVQCNVTMRYFKYNYSKNNIFKQFKC